MPKGVGGKYNDSIQVSLCNCLFIWGFMMKQSLWFNNITDKSEIMACQAPWAQRSAVNQGFGVIRLYLNVCGRETEAWKGSFSWTMMITACWLFPLSVIYSERARAVWVAIKAFVWSALIRRGTMRRIRRASSRNSETNPELKRALFNSNVTWYHSIREQPAVRGS